MIYWGSSSGFLVFWECANDNGMYKGFFLEETKSRAWKMRCIQPGVYVLVGVEDG